LETFTEAAPDQPGHYIGLPNRAYHSGPGVSKSQLDLLNDAPALIEWSRNAPRDEEARAAVDLGDAFHALVLEPERFDAEYAVEFQPPAGALVTADDVKAACDERGIGYTTKDTKQALVAKLLDHDPDAPVLEKLRADWAAGLNGRRVLTAEENRKLMLMRESALAHPFARALLQAHGPVESSIYWVDQETGLLCRIRPDKIAALANVKVIVDVKVTGDIERFAASIEDYRYHVQEAFYREGCEQHFGEPCAFVFLVVSSKRDAGRYPVRCFALQEDDRIAGENEMRKDLATYAECQRTGLWPGVETITRPEWARRRDAA
jgi:exodeoxyribonuclease VIII